MNEKFKVGIFCVTYNHEKYIEKCLEGFVNQKTNFPFQAVIYDDCSTDKTREIINKYAKKYPQIIKPIFSDVNIAQTKGFFHVNQIIYRTLESKYIAYCEGDDYWTDENKLQIQVDFLDHNPDFSGCFHKCLRKNVITNEDVCYTPSDDIVSKKDIFTIEDTSKKYFIETCSVMYRWDNYQDTILEIFPNNILNGDTFIIYFFSLQGKIKYIDRLMSVKTINDKGIWNSVNQTQDERNLKYWQEIINFPIEVRKLFDKYNCNLPYKAPENEMKNILTLALKLGRYDLITQIAKTFPEMFKFLLNLDNAKGQKFIEEFKRIQCEDLNNLDLLSLENNLMLKKYFLSSIKDKKVLCWGASKFLNNFINNNLDDRLNIIGIVDKNEDIVGTNIGKYNVSSISDIQNLNPDVIWVTIENNSQYIYPQVKDFIKQNYPNIEIIPNIFD